MVSYSVLIAFGVALSVTACRQTGVERAKQQSGSPALDTAASPRARPAASAPGDSIAIDSVRGCPFECCQYMGGGVSRRSSRSTLLQGFRPIRPGSFALGLKLLPTAASFSCIHLGSL